MERSRFNFGISYDTWKEIWDGTGDGSLSQLYNLGGHNEKAYIEIVKIILSELGKSERWL